MNPSDRCSGGHYGESSSGHAYKMFDLSAYDGAVLFFNASVALINWYDNYYDYFNVYYKPEGGDFSSGDTRILHVTGDEDISFKYDISTCNTSTCTVGFGLTSLYGGDDGVGIYDFGIYGITIGTADYKVMDGTSMATPHVSGLAALLKAYNPSYTYSDIIQSIKAGGDSETSLAAATSTGKAADAWGSLCYINAPTGVTATVEQ
jgi:thermitase